MQSQTRRYLQPQPRNNRTGSLSNGWYVRNGDKTHSEPNKIVKFSKKENEDEKIKEVINLSNLSLIRSIICEYFGVLVQIDIKETANKHDVHRNTVSKYSSLIKKQLRMIERQAEEKVCIYLEEEGKVAND